MFHIGVPFWLKATSLPYQETSDALKAKGFKIRSSGRQLLKWLPRDPFRLAAHLLVVPESLIVPSGAPRDEVFSVAQDGKMQLCSLEVAPALCIARPDIFQSNLLRFAMEPVRTEDEQMNVFVAGYSKGDESLFLDAFCGDNEAPPYPDKLWVFQL